jgi:hypothetical protein
MLLLSKAGKQPPLRIDELERRWIAWNEMPSESRPAPYADEDLLLYEEVIELLFSLQGTDGRAEPATSEGRRHWERIGWARRIAFGQDTGGIFEPRWNLHRMTREYESGKRVCGSPAEARQYASDMRTHYQQQRVEDLSKVFLSDGPYFSFVINEAHRQLQEHIQEDLLSTTSEDIFHIGPAEVVKGSASAPGLADSNAPNAYMPAPEQQDPQMLKTRRRVVLLHFFRGDLGEAINSPVQAEDLFLRYGDKGRNFKAKAGEAVRNWSDKGKIIGTNATQVINAVVTDLKYIQQYLTAKQRAEVDEYIMTLEGKRKKNQ